MKWLNFNWICWRKGICTFTRSWKAHLFHDKSSLLPRRCRAPTFFDNSDLVWIWEPIFWTIGLLSLWDLPESLEKGLLILIETLSRSGDIWVVLIKLASSAFCSNTCDWCLLSILVGEYLWLQSWLECIVAKVWKIFATCDDCKGKHLARKPFDERGKVKNLLDSSSSTPEKSKSSLWPVQILWVLSEKHRSSFVSFGQRIKCLYEPLGQDQSGVWRGRKRASLVFPWECQKWSSRHFDGICTEHRDCYFLSDDLMLRYFPNFTVAVMQFMSCFLRMYCSTIWLTSL